MEPHCHVEPQHMHRDCEVSGSNPRAGSLFSPQYDFHIFYSSSGLLC